MVNRMALTIAAVVSTIIISTTPQPENQKDYEPIIESIPATEYIDDEPIPLAEYVAPPKNSTDGLTKMRVTCYTSPPDAITASGQTVREGACAAKRDWIGRTAYVYDLSGNYIGKWDITDTGGHPRITEGRSIDIWKPTLEECYQFVGEYGDYLFVEIE